LNDFDNQVGRAKAEDLRVTNVQVGNVSTGMLKGLSSSHDVSNCVVELCGSG
jgi:hypothetical protein